jgi:hypothetical protein
MNAKMGKDLYRINLSNSEGVMVVGVTGVASGKGMVYSLVASF